MEALEIKTAFTINLGGFALPITETVLVSWFVMAVLIAVALVLTRRLREIPRGAQAVLEAGIEFLNGFSRKEFGPWAKYLTNYMGTLFLFILAANLVGVLTPVEVKIFGLHFEPPFQVKPPTRDINVTAALAILSILLVLVFGILGRGVKGWFKGLFYPIPLMLPFNILEYFTRPISLCLRLFGNILGGFILMHLITGLIPLGVPMIFSLYFDFFDGILQAVVFVFLTTMYLSEAMRMPGHEG